MHGVRTFSDLISGMLEFWKRKEKHVALEWGMVGFENCESAPDTCNFIPSILSGVALCTEGVNGVSGCPLKNAPYRTK